eukprot:CAMPEP_0172527514 /NCGR_PEP_ID=MMETSP1067-20121228/2181_1 /TAXON_ID=265564 ORGANISM="Thalassiosira punctigera, Strain Tpunct2005C2" /NCGR_SAMPLE_ID=MMETSP1067 /ASSEMBLY_ACC=CAM_ASM_000444 /LENGTH=194 /DNA_ID=CAMNT_0013311263 /DNA_START=9 /DNA_END=593 /DNA_ORIENTATION=+
MTKALFTFICATLIHRTGAFHTSFYSIKSPVAREAPISATPLAGAKKSPHSPRTPFFSATSDDDTESPSTPTHPTAESILDEFHQSELPFRIVVIGNGAILETTSKLGPTSKSSISPKSGERLLTFASEDQSFEFHVKVEQVCKVAFVTTKRRVARFLSENGTPICSLILGDRSDEAEGWFDGLVEKHGDEIIM